MKDRSILSALKDGEIHSPFREQCIQAVESSPDLKSEFDGLYFLSSKLEEAQEPDFEARKAQAKEKLLQKVRHGGTLREIRSPAARPGGLWLTWPLAAAAALVLSFSALAGGYALRSAGLEVSFNPPVTPERLALLEESSGAEYRTQKIPEIRVTVPKRFTLPAEEEGELLTSSFEGGW